jgi:hypothetical protein
MYIAGVLRNNPEDLVNWIQNPKAVNEKTGMPALGVSGQDAIDIVAFLHNRR